MTRWIATAADSQNSAGDVQFTVERYLTQASNVCASHDANTYQLSYQIAFIAIHGVHPHVSGHVFPQV